VRRPFALRRARFASGTAGGVEQRVAIQPAGRPQRGELAFKLA
jgi:hypothetical protein